MVFSDHSSDDGLGIYIHWPYCLSKCPYCDFNSHVLTEIDNAAWIESYHKAIDQHLSLLEQVPVKSIFFGGGTPSLMPLEILEHILERIEKRSGALPDEITLEANPTSFETEKFKDMRALGVNRLSLGVQSLDDRALKFLGREHDVKTALHAFEVSREIFPSISFDLIYALPGQSLLSWEKELKEALSHSPDHLSLYQLTIEPGTEFYTKHRRGELLMPSEEYAADLYELTDQITKAHNLYSYEVSNYARPGYECRHNLIYWQGDPYIGIGPGAHGRLKLEEGPHHAARWHATRQRRAPHIWLDQVLKNECGYEKREEMSDQDRAYEILMTSLRLHDGISYNALEGKFPKIWREVVDLENLQTMIAHKYLEDRKDRIMATAQGRLVLNSLIEFILKPSSKQSQRIKTASMA